MSKCRWVVPLFLLVLAACEPPTSFNGSPKVADGPRGCWNKCSAWGLEFAGMVAMGEYSDGCICRVPARVGQTSDPQSVDPNNALGSLSASVGVVMAMRAREEAQRNAATNPALAH